MSDQENHSDRDPKWDDLRRRAEDRARQRREKGTGVQGEQQTPSPNVRNLEEAERLIHELHVHQIELEMQNDELLQAREELAEARDRYKALYEFAPVGYVTLIPSGWIHQSNLTFAGMLGRERSLLERSRFRPLVEPGDRGVFDRLLTRCHGGEGGRAEVRLLRNDETPVWFLIEADPVPRDSFPPVEIRLTAMDISRRKTAEVALQKSEERLRLVIEGGELGTWDRDLLTNQVVWNQKLYELLGRDPRTAITGETFFDSIHEEDLARVRKRLEDIWEKGGEFFDEFRIVRGDGEERWLAASGRVYRNREGKPVRMTGVNYDITGRKRAEEALVDLNESLEHRVAERTEESRQRARQLQSLALELSSAEDRERGRIAGVLHDDLQQMLASLKFQLHALQPASRSPEQIVDTVERLEQLVGECIRKTRALSYDLSPPALQQHGLLPVLDWLARDMKQNHGLEVIVEAEPEAEPASGEVAALLYRSVRELLFNAVKHAGSKSAVIGARRAGDEIIITVRDDGRGMDVDEAKAKKDHGDGFGLFSIDERVASLGGSMEIESAPGEGCAVTLRIPARAGQAEGDDLSLHAPPGESASRVPRELSGERGRNVTRILIVDDHDVVRHGLVSLLEDHGIFEVVAEAANGHEAVRLAFELVPDVVLMDVAMPDMDGITATKEIKDSMPQVRVIGLSMYDDATTRRRMLEAGASDYVTKSEVSDRLIATIKRA